MKILIVDDEPLFCELLKAELSACGHTNVHSVNSGAEAISSIKTAETPFDCALLDIDMPGIDGIELCRLLRFEPLTADIPLVMVTARSEVESVDKAFAAGATDYLTKPIDRRDLRGRMTMASAMARERVARKTTLANNKKTEQFPFEEACRLEAEYACIDYLALQNYVLKLGSMRMFNHVAIGFQVANARELFLTLDNSAFRETMSDIAEVIVEATMSGNPITSYAGSGFFVVLFDRHSATCPERLADQIEQRLQILNGWYAQLGQLPVRIKIGAPISRGLVSLRSPVEILEKALINTKKPITTLGGLQEEDAIAQIQSQPGE
ncbi:response regulator [Ruegeria sp. SCPT10]|uniref:response regulator n=1 Tax=Ruegeria sp. SCP10 TaxID=3141377 RepID=UPI00333D22F1